MQLTITKMDPQDEQKLVNTLPQKVDESNLKEKTSEVDSEQKEVRKRETSYSYFQESEEKENNLQVINVEQQRQFMNAYQNTDSIDFENT